MSLTPYSGESFSTSPSACAPFAFSMAAKRRSDTDAIIQRVVFFLRWVKHFIHLINMLAWKLWTPKICSWGKTLSLSIIFSVQVWQWRILTIRKETLYEKSNKINFYTFVIEITLTKEPWSLCYLVVFFGFHSHYLHSNITRFPVVLMARKHIGFRLVWSNCSVPFFITRCGFFIRSVSIQRNFLAWCHRKIFFPSQCDLSSTFFFVIHWYKRFFDGCR